MLSTKKKILYTVLTSPFAFITFKAYKWQTRRKVEKNIEIENRENRLKETPLLIKKENLNLINDEWEFRPIMLQGSFEENLIHINKTKEAEPGYHIISPFKLDKDSNRSNALIVDRGWVPYYYDIQNIMSKNS